MTLRQTDRNIKKFRPPQTSKDSKYFKHASSVDELRKVNATNPFLTIVESDKSVYFYNGTPLKMSSSLKNTKDIVLSSEYIMVIDGRYVNTNEIPASDFISNVEAFENYTGLDLNIASTSAYSNHKIVLNSVDQSYTIESFLYESGYLTVLDNNGVDIISTEIPNFYNLKLMFGDGQFSILVDSFLIGTITTNIEFTNMRIYPKERGNIFTDYIEIVDVYSGLTQTESGYFVAGQTEALINKRRGK